MKHTVLWTIQRTGATTYRNKHKIPPAIFGRKGEYAELPPSKAGEIASKSSFKMPVGAPMDWSKVLKIIESTPDHRHIILYRRDSTSRILSWYFGNSTGAMNPTKLEENLDRVQQFISDNTIPIDALVHSEEIDLGRLATVCSILKMKEYHLEVIAYEDLYEPSEGYGTRDYYNQLSDVSLLKSKILSSEVIRRSRKILDDAQKSGLHHK